MPYKRNRERKDPRQDPRELEPHTPALRKPMMAEQGLKYPLKIENHKTNYYTLDFKPIDQVTASELQDPVKHKRFLIGCSMGAGIFNRHFSFWTSRWFGQYEAMMGLCGSEEILLLTELEDRAIYCFGTKCGIHTLFGKLEEDDAYKIVRKSFDDLLEGKTKTNFVEAT